jgi:hypothetical protein
MKKLAIRSVIMISFALLIFNFLGVIIDEDNALADNRRAAVCHYPPDDPTNPQTLYLPERAVQAHLRHGDVLGECPSGCLFDASLCDDGNLCTSDTCLPSGECENTPVSCDDGNPCTSDSCDAATGCLSVANDGVSCDDGNACTYDDLCISTVCTGQTVPGCCAIDANCNDGDPCTIDSCVSGTCTYDAKNCESEDKCVVGLCDQNSGDCTTTPVTCNDGNACTDDFCDSGIGCYFVPTSNPPLEICGDDIDNDCDGLTDFNDVDCSISCEFIIGPVYWESPANYLNRILTVDHTIYNGNDNMVVQLSLEGVSTTNGVILQTSLPLNIGDIPGYSNVTYTLQFYVPPGVGSFFYIPTFNTSLNPTSCTADVIIPPPPA